MAVRYLEGIFKIDGLELKTEQEMYNLLQKMMKAMREVHPHLRFDSDIELDMDDGWKAGKFELEVT